LVFDGQIPGSNLGPEICYLAEDVGYFRNLARQKLLQ
jgi:hypothetical protein